MWVGGLPGRGSQRGLWAADRGPEGGSAGSSSGYGSAKMVFCPVVEVRAGKKGCVGIIARIIGYSFRRAI